jgi:hypothetical protein
MVGGLMNLAYVIDDLRGALDTIDGLRVPEWGASKISAPAGLVLPPERIQYGTTYGAGCDRYPDIWVMVLVDDPTNWRAFAELAPYCAGSGGKSVRAAIEGYPYTACDPQTVKVTEGEFDVVKYAGIPYLAAIFHVDIIGTE